MNYLEFQLRGVGDPRLAPHATSALPAWLWAIDGRRILWANPVGARLFGTANGAVLAEKTFGPANALRRQVARLANRLPANGAIRLERLRGFGTLLGALVTCGCARLEFSDGSQGVLVAAAEPIGRAMPLAERLQLLVRAIDSPAAAFTSDGMFIGASATARALPGFHHLVDANLGNAPRDALKQGRVELPIGIGQLVLQRVGAGADVGLVALIAATTPRSAHARTITPPIAPHEYDEDPKPEDQAMLDHKSPADATEAAVGLAAVDEFAEPPIESASTSESAEAAPTEPAPHSTPDYEAPALSGEAPAEFALDDEFTMPPQPFDAETIQAPEPSMATHHDDDDLLDEEPSVEEESREEESAEEPSPYVEAVADEPALEAVPAPDMAGEHHEQEHHEHQEQHEEPGPMMHEAAWHDEPGPEPRTAPLRFLWQMDVDGRFTLDEEAGRLTGPRSVAALARSWREVADSFDPDGHVLRAVATRNAWTGVDLNWPVDGGDHLPVELSGLLLLDRAGNYAGYRGFGICRDLEAMTRLDALRHHEALNGPPPQALSAGIVAKGSPVGFTAVVPIDLSAGPTT